MRKLAGVIVTYQANRIYLKAVAKAEKRWEKERTRIYVTEDPLKPRRLVTINRSEWRTIKEMMRIRRSSYSIIQLKAGAYYYTGDKSGRDSLSIKEKEVRRLAFVRMNLRRAKLV